MPKYLQKTSGRIDWQRYHLLSDDGKHAVCGQRGSIEAGFNGWQVVELETVALSDLCGHCFTMTQPKPPKPVKPPTRQELELAKLLKWKGRE